MSEIIYVDVLVILNLFITLFLLLTTEIFTKETSHRVRLLIGSFLGGIYSLVVFLPEMGVIFNLLTRIIAGGIITYTTFGFKSFKRFIKIFSVFFLSTFLFAGLMIAMWILFKPHGMIINNSTVYFGVSIPVLIVSTAVCYFISFVFATLREKNKPVHTVFDFTLSSFGKTINGRAMLDTGNTITEPFSSFPVVVCTYEFLKEILPADGDEFFKGNVTQIEKIHDEELVKKIRIVSFSTVSGGGVLPSFRPEKLYIKNGVQTDKVYIAVTSKQKYINGSYDMLLNPNLF